MDVDNYIGFTVRVPIGLHVVTPMVTSNTLFDEFALHFSTVLSTSQFQSHRKEVELALSSGALCGVHRHEISLAIRSLAVETAEQFCSEFLVKLKAKVHGGQVSTTAVGKLKTPEEQSAEEEAKRQQEEEEKRKKEEEEKRQEEERQRQAEIKRQQEEEERRQEEQRRRQEEEKRKQEEEEKRQQEAGRQQQVQDQQLLEKLKKVGQCPQGYEWFKDQGGYRCGGGGHFVTDAELLSH